jgi:hypothetical protein
MPGDLEELFNEMEPLYNAMMEEQAKMKALEKDIIASMNELALKHYPEIKNLEKEGFDELVDVIWRAADKYVVGVNHVAGTMQIE